MKKKRTKRIIQISLLLGTIISLFFVPWLLVWAWILPLPDTVQEQADEAVDHGFEGIIIYVDQKGKAPAFYTAGWHDRVKKIPAKKDALFKIASVSKLYDAVAVAKLVDDKRLSLNKTLANYLPELRGRIDNADEITLKMMVQHRSGLPNFTDTPDYWSNPPEGFEANLKLIENKPANFEPGEDYEYCNTNYLLLNKIMDEVLGYENFAFIQKEILGTLHLKNTFASINDVNLEDVMGGYHVDYDGNLNTEDQGMLATAEDVGIFIRALNEGTLLSKSEQRIYAAIYEFEHSGWVPGYQSFAHYYKDIDCVVVTFYNTTDADLILWNLAEIINGRISDILRES